MLSEISTPEIDWNSRSKIMEALNQRDRDRQELELEQTFENLIGKATGVDNDDIESIASRSATDFRNTGKMNIFKPTLKGMTPRNTEPVPPATKPSKV